MNFTTKLNQIFLYRDVNVVTSENHVELKKIVLEAIKNGNNRPLQEQILDLPRDLPPEIPRSQLVFKEPHFEVLTSLNRVVISSLENENIDDFIGENQQLLKKLDFIEAISCLGVLQQIGASIDEKEYDDVKQKILQEKLTKINSDTKLLSVVIDYYYSSGVFPDNQYVVKTTLSLDRQNLIIGFDSKYQKKIRGMSLEKVEEGLKELKEKIKEISKTLIDELCIQQ